MMFLVVTFVVAVFHSFCSLFSLGDKTWWEKEFCASGFCEDIPPGFITFQKMIQPALEMQDDTEISPSPEGIS